MDKSPKKQQISKFEEITKQEQEILNKESNDEFKFRFLKRDDYDRGFPEILSQLTVVGKVTKEDYERRFDEMFPSHAHIYKIVVIVDNKTDKIIGCGTIFMEKKFLRQTGTCGHIEDVSVDSNYRGKKLGLKLINVLKQLGIVNDCYKILLDCADHNIAFYEMNGFKLKEKCMAWYRSESRL